MNNRLRVFSFLVAAIAVVAFVGPAQDGTVVLNQPINAALDDLIYQNIQTPDVQRASMLSNGSDVWTDIVRADDLNAMVADPNISLASDPSLHMCYISMNASRTPGNNPAFRRAVSHSIDRDFLANNLLGGAVNPLEHVMPSGNAPDFDPNAPTYPFDLNAARDVLDAAGFAQSTAGPVADAPAGADNHRINPATGELLEDLDFWEIGPLLAPTSHQIGVTISQALREIGLPINEIPENNFSVFIDETIGFHNYDLFFLCRGGQTPFTLSLSWFSEQFVPYGWNFSAMSDPEVDILSVAVQNARSAEELTDATIALQNLLQELAVWAPVYNRPQHVAHRTDNVKGLVSTSFAGSFSNVGQNNPWSRVNIQSTTGTGSDSFGRTTGGSARLINDPAIDTLNVWDGNSSESQNFVTLGNILAGNAQSPFASGLVLQHATDPNSVIAFLQDESKPSSGRVIETVEVGGANVFDITYFFLEGVTYHDGVPMTAADVYFANILSTFLPFGLSNPSFVQDVTLLAEDNAVKITYRNDGLNSNGLITGPVSQLGIWLPVFNDALATVGAPAVSADLSNLKSIVQGLSADDQTAVVEAFRLYQPHLQTNANDPSLTNLVGVGPYVYSSQEDAGETSTTLTWNPLYFGQDAGDSRLGGSARIIEAGYTFDASQNSAGYSSNWVW